MVELCENMDERARSSAQSSGLTQGSLCLSEQRPQALLIDGKAVAARVVEETAAAARDLDVARRAPGPRRGAGRRGSGEPGLCALQGEGRRELRLSFGAAYAAGEHQRGERCSRSSRSSMPIPRSTASSCNCRCPARSIRRRVLETISPAKDVDGFHPVNAGLLAIGDLGARSCRARRRAR